MGTLGTFVDHMVVQGTAVILGHDIIIITATAGGEEANYRQHVVNGGPGQPMLLGHIHENHYQSLGGEILLRSRSFMTCVVFKQKKASKKIVLLKLEIRLISD